MKWKDIETAFSKIDTRCTILAYKKNHDYGSAWMHMRLTSMTDQILVKILRVVQIEKNKGELAVPTDPLAREYIDIINWCRFALMKLETEEYAANHGVGE